jgi:hypothetical protein
MRQRRRWKDSARFCVTGVLGIALAAAPRVAIAEGRPDPLSHDPAAEDPTGGAYSPPTQLFVPAGALPAWRVRAVLSAELQSPSALHAGFRPGVAGEVGLPGGVALAAGTSWVGSDVNPETGRSDFNLGLSPFVRARIRLAGSDNGLGWQLGTSVTYKFVGFEGDPGESELAISLAYRQMRYELGFQGVAGKDFGSVAADTEGHAYAVYRVIPNVAVGAAGQFRQALVSAPEDSKYDVLGGAIATVVIDRYMLGLLAGVSSLGLTQGHVGAVGQLFVSAPF